MTDPSSVKTCPRCGEAKPLDAFYRHQRYQDGRVPCCKQCQNAASQAGERRRRAEHKAWVAAYRERMASLSGEPVP